MGSDHDEAMMAQATGPPSFPFTADIELINIDQINKAYERLLTGDVRYRFVINMASLKT